MELKGEIWGKVWWEGLDTSLGGLTGLLTCPCTLLLLWFRPLEVSGQFLEDLPCFSVIRDCRDHCHW